MFDAAVYARGSVDGPRRGGGRGADVGALPAPVRELKMVPAVAAVSIVRNRDAAGLRRRLRNVDGSLVVIGRLLFELYIRGESHRF